MDLMCLLCRFLKAEIFKKRLLKKVSAQGIVLETDPDTVKTGVALPVNHFPSPICLLLFWTHNVNSLLPIFCRLLRSRFACWNQIQCLTALKNHRKKNFRNTFFFWSNLMEKSLKLERFLFILEISRPLWSAVSKRYTVFDFSEVPLVRNHWKISF